MAYGNENDLSGGRITTATLGGSANISVGSNWVTGNSPYNPGAFGAGKDFNDAFKHGVDPYPMWGSVLQQNPGGFQSVTGAIGEPADFLAISFHTQLDRTAAWVYPLGGKSGGGSDKNYSDSRVAVGQLKADAGTICRPACIM